MTEQQKRLIIFVQVPRWGSEADRGHFHRLMLHFSGDLARTFDPGMMGLSVYAGHLSRIELIASPGAMLSPLVVIMETFPLPQHVLAARKLLTAQVPSLAKAIWLIWYDGKWDVSFKDAAGRIGDFDQPSLDQFPIWTNRQDLSRYLIITPSSTDLSKATEQLSAYVRLRRAITGPMNKP